MGAQRDIHSAPVRVSIKAPAFADDSVVQAVAETLQQSSGRAQRRRLLKLLKEYGASEASIDIALRLVARGTAVKPNARLRGHALDRSDDLGVVQAVREHEVWARAQYVINAALRLRKAAEEGDAVEALKRERRYAEQHEIARRGRLDAAAQVQYTAKTFGWTTQQGTLVGWYHTPGPNNDVECLRASGHNFIAERGTTIGLPGSVHPGCRCYAGPPHPEATRTVNQAVARIKHLHGPKVVPLRKESA